MLLKRSKFIIIEGKDSFNFLQGQLTQDLKKVSLDTPKWSLVLTPNGKIIQLIRVRLISNNSYLLEVPDIDRGITFNRLKRFLIRTRAEIEYYERAFTLSSIDLDSAYQILSSWSEMDESNFGSDLKLELKSLPTFEPNLMGLFKGNTVGPKTSSFLETKLGIDELAVFSSDDLKSQVLAKYAEFKSENFDAVVKSETIFSVFEILTSTLYFDSEVISSIIPAEIPYMVINSVSFEKGCYVGQELVERIDARNSTTPHSIVTAVFGLDGRADDFDAIFGNEVDLLVGDDIFKGSIMTKCRLGNWMVIALRIPKKLLDRKSNKIAALNPSQNFDKEQKINGFFIPPIGNG